MTDERRDSITVAIAPAEGGRSWRVARGMPGGIALDGEAVTLAEAVAAATHYLQVIGGAHRHRIEYAVGGTVPQPGMYPRP